MINKELVNNIYCLLDKGVISGISPDPKPGEMCLEQVISYALGEEVTDRPSCVAQEVRDFVTSLNDKAWSSNSARAEGMRELSIAQLGSNSLDQKEFREELSFAVITKLLPSMFRDLGEERWEKEINSLEKAKSLKEAREAAYTAADAANYISHSDADDDDDYHYAAAAAFEAVDVGFAADVASYAAEATKTGDKYLKMVSHLAVEVLKDMKSPGCQFI